LLGGAHLDELDEGDLVREVEDEHVKNTVG
jgi:hypothetical protein